MPPEKEETPGASAPPPALIELLQAVVERGGGEAQGFSLEWLSDRVPPR